MSKPEYKVPSMDEIRALPWNGFNAISTFSGGGGSSTGYRMAGFKVLWANEFIDAARDTYRANMAPHTILDGRDIRQVQASEILEAIKMQPGEVDLFDGSPPCASFSTAGKRQAGWGKVKKYSDKAQRTDDLFFEYIRLLRDLKPKTFVAENVSGLVKGAAKGYFIEIMRELKASGYRVACKVLDAQWLGVPQSRQRTIFVGVREDLGIEPAHPKPLPYRYSVGDCLRTLQKGGESKLLNKQTDTYAYWSQTKPGDDLSIACLKMSGKDSFRTHYKQSPDRPANTVTQGAQQLYHWDEPRTLNLKELRRICGFPDDYILSGDFTQQWERCGRSVPPVMMSHIAAAVRDNILRKL
jgi:DNA (cytosine-5)-methyltransferase 1